MPNFEEKTLEINLSLKEIMMVGLSLLIPLRFILQLIRILEFYMINFLKEEIMKVYNLKQDRAQENWQEILKKNLLQKELLKLGE